MKTIEIGIDRIDLDVKNKISIAQAGKAEVVVRLDSRTGKGSISEKRVAHTTKISKLLDNAYEKARQATQY